MKPYWTAGERSFWAWWCLLEQWLKVDPRALSAEILLLSDSREELDAARQAGLQTVWLMRDGELDSTSTHPQARDFDGIRV